MSDRFQIFRLSLLPRFQRDLWTDPNLTREVYLNEVFRKNWEFSHWGSNFHYVFDGNLSPGETILGRLGKATLSEENLPPEEGLTETIREGWKACVIAVDPKDHDDGQKLSVEVDLRVGKPYSVAKGLIDHINFKNQNSAFEIEINPIFNSQSFWDFAQKNQGNITRLTFEFITPNGLWSAESNLKSELKLARDKFKATRVNNTFINSNGLDVDKDEIREAVSYAESGSATIKARTKSNKTFNSSAQQQTTTINIDDTTGESMIVRVARQVSRVFGRE